MTKIPWGDLGVEVVVESTGVFTQKTKLKGILKMVEQKRLSLVHLQKARILQ